VVAGLAFGWGVVKLSDWIMGKVNRWTRRTAKPAMEAKTAATS
jgi:hypothetical protein